LENLLAVHNQPVVIRSQGFSGATRPCSYEMNQDMLSYRLTINDDWFYLSGGYNIAALKGALAAAVHSGGGFVDIITSMRSQVSLLITTHTNVKFETILSQDLPEVTDSTPSVNPLHSDDDYWLD
jgi:hypothetical protein